MSSLRQRLIRLAYARPALRADVLRLIVASSGPWVIHGETYTREMLETGTDRFQELGSDEAKIMGQVERVLGRLRFPLTIYRGVRVDEAPDESRITFGNRRGGHWTWDRQVAIHFAKGTHANADDAGDFDGDNPYILEAVVRSAGDVDWLQTIDLYLGFSDENGSLRTSENEIVVRRGQFVRATPIR